MKSLDAGNRTRQNLAAGPKNSPTWSDFLERNFDIGNQDLHHTGGAEFFEVPQRYTNFTYTYIYICVCVTVYIYHILTCSICICNIYITYECIICVIDISFKNIILSESNGLQPFAQQAPRMSSEDVPLEHGKSTIDDCPISI